MGLKKIAFYRPHWPSHRIGAKVAQSNLKEPVSWLSGQSIDEFWGYSDSWVNSLSSGSAFPHLDPCVKWALNLGGKKGKVTDSRFWHPSKLTLWHWVASNLCQEWLWLTRSSCISCFRYHVLLHLNKKCSNLELHLNVSPLKFRQGLCTSIGRVCSGRWLRAFFFSALRFKMGDNQRESLILKLDHLIFSLFTWENLYLCIIPKYLPLGEIRISKYCPSSFRK